MASLKPYRHPFEPPYVTWAEVVTNADGHNELRDAAGKLLKSNYWWPMDQDDLYAFVSRQFAEIARLTELVEQQDQRLDSLERQLDKLEDTVRDQD